MSEAILTTAGRDLFAVKQGAGQALVIDRFLLANIPALDVNAAANPLEPLPVIGDRVAELGVTRSGYVNADKVVYSLYLGTQAGDYTFNWVGLLAEDDTLVAVRYIDPLDKYATSGQDLGNAITRNFLISYTDVQAITNIVVGAETWQLAFDDSSETGKGLIEIATQAEVDAGGDDQRAVTAKKMAKYIANVEDKTVGSILPMSGDIVPEGYIAAENVELNRATYPNLWAYAQATSNFVVQATKDAYLEIYAGYYGTGDGSTTFTTPDYRGETFRGWDNGRGVDAGRAIGSFQLDTMQGHHHNAGVGRTNNPTTGFSTGMKSTSAGPVDYFGAAVVTNPKSDGSNGTPRTGPETRARNIAVMPCIKY